jgi:O-antigen biosynthesis alpha-1,2-rhamnosyltransferase
VSNESKALRHRVFLECTSTYASRYNTGIQRAVRNLVTASIAIGGPWECVPVVYNGRYLEAIAGLTRSAAAGGHLTAVDRLRRGFHLARRGVTRVLPSARLRTALHSQRLEYGLRRAVYAAKNTRQWIRSFKAGTGMRVEFRQDDTLVLLDSTWSVDLTHELRRARAAGAAVWVVVNDLIPIEYPDLAPEGTPILLDKWLRRTVPFASGLLGISRAVAEGLRELLLRTLATGPKSNAMPAIDHFYLGAGLDRVAVEPPLLDGVSGAFAREMGSVYIMVGTIEPRKNHALVLDAFDGLWADDAAVSIFIFGRLGWRSEDLLRRIRGHPQFGRRLVWFESATDAELDFAYRHAAGLIFASACEGFGLPMVEAMQYGLPVLANDIPVFREIGRDYPSYFDARIPRSLVELIQRIESTTMKTPERPVGRTPRHWLSWADSARMLLEKVTAKPDDRVEAG